MRPLFHPLFVLMALSQSLGVGLEPVRAQDPLETERQAMAKQITELIRQLGSDSFQEREHAQGKLIVIGTAALKQIQEASKDPDREIARRANALLEVFRNKELERAEVHVVGLYESRGGKAIVKVHQTKTPVILVLCSYESVTWNVQAGENVEILQVIASGYEMQTVEGTDAPISTYSYDERTKGPDGRPFYFYTYDHDEEKYPNMVSKVLQLTGKKVSSFQGRYSFKSVPFEIGTGE